MIIKNVASFKAGIKKDFLQKLQDDRLAIENEVNQELARAIDELRVYYTGATKRATSSKLTTFSDSAVIRATTVKSAEMDTFYPQYVYFGRGTSRKYGPRRWLEKGLNAFIQKNNITVR